MLTKQMTFVIIPYDTNHCPTLTEAQQNMVILSQEYDLAYWSYECFVKGEGV
jgi:hypothetical protein